MNIVAILIALVTLIILLVGAFIIGRWLYRMLNTRLGENQMNPHDNTNNDTNNIGRYFNQNISIRFIIIGIIALIMLIPLGQVSSVVYERDSLYKQVLHNIASQWGKPQIITGPALIVPIVERYSVYEKLKDKEGQEKMELKEYSRNRNIVILPKRLNKKIKLNEHYRYRGIYKSLVYTSDIQVNGAFILPDLSKISDNLEKIHYDKAYFIMGLSDTKAIEHVSDLSLNQEHYNFEPGTKLRLNSMKSGFHAPLELRQNQQKYTFSFALKTNGSSSIRFSAFGEKTEIHVDSSWKHPSFQGSILPMERNISEQGFQATWKIPSLARNFPQTWMHELHTYKVNQLLTGVDLFEPVALYSLIDRAIKYGILFIMLTFLTFLIFEITQKSKLHYVQYLLIGGALGMFFLVLLSLSEHLVFLTAYIIASLITILSISIYTWFNNRSLKQFLAISTLLTALYTIMYSLLQLEDYALLMGTGLLLTILFVLMWITRNLKVSQNA